MAPYGDCGPAVNKFQDLSAGKDRLTYFIYNPWYEAVFNDSSRLSQNAGTYRRRGQYRRDGTGPYWFGNNSTRGVLAETVAGLLEEAKSPIGHPGPDDLVGGKGKFRQLLPETGE